MLRDMTFSIQLSITTRSITTLQLDTQHYEININDTQQIIVLLKFFTPTVLMLSVFLLNAEAPILMLYEMGLYIQKYFNP